MQGGSGCAISGAAVQCNGHFRTRAATAELLEDSTNNTRCGACLMTPAKAATDGQSHCRRRQVPRQSCALLLLYRVHRILTDVYLEEYLCGMDWKVSKMREVEDQPILLAWIKSCQ